MKLLVVLALVALVGSAIARPARDLKSDLITKGQDLVKKADDAVKKLEDAKKTHEVTVVKAEEARITKLIADLTAATDDAKIKMLERELGALEARLNHELTRINQTPVVNPPTDPKPDTPPSKRDAKSDLIMKGNDLVKKAEDAAMKLTTDMKTQAATMVKTHEAHLKKLMADLTAATDDAKIKTLEHELTLAENRLNTELTKIAGMPATPPKTTDPVVPPTKRDLKDDLITKGNDLVKKVEDAVTKLETDKKTQQATMLKTQEAHLKKAVADLTAATDDAKIKMLERELTGLEARVNHELTRINMTPVVNPPTDPKPVPANPSKRDAKSDLIMKGNDLVKKAEDAVMKLTTDMKTQAATMVKTHEAHLKKLIADLTAATDDAKIKTLEHELTLAENRLNTELTKISGMPATPPKTTDPVVPPTKRDAKSDLIEKANALLKKAEDAVTKLETDKKTAQATMLKTQEAHIKKVIADLTAATDDAKVKALEHDLTTADARLTHELARIAAMPVDPPKTPTDPIKPTNP